MKLSQLSAEPKLIEISLDDEEIVKTYGEPIVFYTYDRQPIDVFMKLASLDNNNMSGIVDIVKNLLLDENGKEIITKNKVLPMPVMMKAITKVTELLGK